MLNIYNPEWNALDSTYGFISLPVWTFCFSLLVWNPGGSGHELCRGRESLKVKRAVSPLSSGSSEQSAQRVWLF